MTSTLTDLERKLVDLERELSSIAKPSEARERPDPAPTPPTPAEAGQGTLRVEDLRRDIADLVKFRDQLEAVARELVSEYDRLVARLQRAEHALEVTRPPTTRRSDTSRGLLSP